MIYDQLDGHSRSRVSEFFIRKRDDMSVQPDHLVDISNLCFRYRDRDIFNNVNITVPRGKIVAIMGPSGSGKTTLLRLIGGLLLPDSGQIKVNDQDVHSLKKPQLCGLRRKMGLLFQSGALFCNCHLSEDQNKNLTGKKNWNACPNNRQSGRIKINRQDKSQNNADIRCQHPILVEEHGGMRH